MTDGPNCMVFCISYCYERWLIFKYFQTSLLLLISSALIRFWYTVNILANQTCNQCKWIKEGGCLKERERRILSGSWFWCTQLQSATCKTFLSLLEQALGRQRWADLCQNPTAFWCCSAVPQARDKLQWGKQRRFVLLGNSSEFPLKCLWLQQLEKASLCGWVSALPSSLEIGLINPPMFT